PVAIYTDAVDDLSTALYISPQYELLTGYTPEQRLMDPGLWVRMLHPDDRERVLTESVRTNETGDPFDMEYRVIRADGSVAWLHDHAIVVAGPDGRACGTACCRTSRPRRRPRSCSERRRNATGSSSRRSRR